MAPFLPDMFFMKNTIPSDPWYHLRSTLHFDLPISLEKAKSLVEAKNVTQHSFLPFIRSDKKVRKLPVKSGHDQGKWKTRAIMYAGHGDTHVFSYYGFMLQGLYEERIKPCSDSILAYRKLGKSNIYFAKEVFDHIRQRSEGVAITMDITGFYDNLDHHLLKQQWQSLLGLPSLPNDHYSVYKAITRFSFLDKTQAYSHRDPTGIRCLYPVQKMRELIKSGRLNIGYNRNPFGIPQGSPMSGLLANIYMFDFDRKLTEEAIKRNAFYRRYSDDILLTCDGADSDYFQNLIRESLHEIRLTENPKKTTISVFSQPNDALEIRPALQYLGFEFDGKRILIRSATISCHKKKAAYCIKKELKHAKRSGFESIRRKKIYSYYSHLRNLMVPDCNPRKQRNFHTYVEEAARILKSPPIQEQMRLHWLWLHRKINAANKKLHEFKNAGE